MSGTIDVDLNNVNSIVNGTLKFAGNFSLGLADVGSTVGSLAGISLILLVILGLVGAAFILIGSLTSMTHKVGMGKSR